MKYLKIANLTGGDWRKHLQRSLFQYRLTPHSVTGDAPGELFFGRKIRDTIPCLSNISANKDEIRDRDSLLKLKGKEYADKKQGAKPKDLYPNDMVLKKNDIKRNKLTPTFHPVPYRVVQKSGNVVTVESPDGVRLSGNSNHFKPHVTSPSVETSSPVSAATSATPAAQQDLITPRGTLTGITPSPSSSDSTPTAPPLGRPRRECKLPVRLFDYELD